MQAVVWWAKCAPRHGAAISMVAYPMSPTVNCSMDVFACTGEGACLDQFVLAALAARVAHAVLVLATGIAITFCFKSCLQASADTYAGQSAKSGPEKDHQMSFLRPRQQSHWHAAGARPCTQGGIAPGSRWWPAQSNLWPAAGLTQQPRPARWLQQQPQDRPAAVGMQVDLSTAL